MTFAQKVSSRKFILVCAIQLVNTIAMFLGSITGGEYVTITTLTFTSYIGVNTYQKGVLKDEPNS